MDRAVLNPDVPGTDATLRGPAHWYFGLACQISAYLTHMQCRNPHSLLSSHPPAPHHPQGSPSASAEKSLPWSCKRGRWRRDCGLGKPYKE